MARAEINLFFFPKLKTEGKSRDMYLLVREASFSFTTYEYIRTVLPGDSHNSFNQSTKKIFKSYLEEEETGQTNI